jgi:hypothetical protein
MPLFGGNRIEIELATLKFFLRKLKLNSLF